MNFDNIVIPLSSVRPNGDDATVGTGFLVNIAGEVYLTTVAHLATGVLDQFDDWQNWSSEINLQDENNNILARVPLFGEDRSGLRVPLFKYGRMTSDHNRLLDLILVLLSADQLKATTSATLELPAPVTSHAGDEVVIVGCRDWPKINSGRYILEGTSADNVLLYINPPSEKGESGGPLLTLSGGLLGINYGADNPSVPGMGLVLNAAIITLLATATNGIIDGLDYGTYASLTGTARG